MCFTFLPSIVNLRGEAEDTVSCKTYALNIRAIKLVKLKAILENRKRNIYASGSEVVLSEGSKGPPGHR